MAKKKPIKPGKVSKKFTPRFWDGVDARLALPREVKRRYALLREQTGADSYMKDLLCQRVVFVVLKLETLEAEAMTSGVALEAGPYGQLVNVLSGLLNKLGLKKVDKAPEDLDAYLAREHGGKKPK